MEEGPNCAYLSLLIQLQSYRLKKKAEHIKQYNTADGVFGS